MTAPDEAALREDVRAFLLRHAGGSHDEPAFLALRNRIFARQLGAIDAVARLHARAMAAGSRDAVVAVPTDVFRFSRLAVHPPERDVRVFHTSGTTGSARGAHHFCDISLYETAARLAAKRYLFPDVERIDLVLLAPPPGEIEGSSLSFMLSGFVDWFGRAARWVVTGGRLLAEALAEACDAAVRDARPLALLGTSFAFVHAEDALGGRRWALPRGSRIMQTGGFKGRSRALDPDGLRGALGVRYGVPEQLIVAEYGMTELSSQLYETTLRHALAGDVPATRRYAAMGWTRVVAVDPLSLAPLGPGERGLVRIEDLANVDSCVAVQTSDVGIVEPDGRLVLLGRADGAEARGCSIAVDELLSGRTP